MIPNSLNCVASRLAYLRVSQNFACRIHTSNKCMKDYYKTLGLEYNASEHQIQQAYSKLSTKYHPDRNRTAIAAGKFHEVTEAYGVLGSKEKKQEYDNRLSMKLKIFLADPASTFTKRVYVNQDENVEKKIDEKKIQERENIFKFSLTMLLLIIVMYSLKKVGL